MSGWWCRQDISRWPSRPNRRHTCCPRDRPPLASGSFSPEAMDSNGGRRNHRNCRALPDTTQVGVAPCDDVVAGVEQLHLALHGAGLGGIQLHVIRAPAICAGCRHVGAESRIRGARGAGQHRICRRRITPLDCWRRSGNLRCSAAPEQCLVGVVGWLNM